MKDSGREPEKVLIVDDIEMNVEILKNILDVEGYDTLCACSVKDALEIMNGNMPQLVLSDYSMPDMNGVEFCKLLKKNPKTRDIPFILITVADSSDVKEAAFEAGVVDYIPKPFERTEVVMRIGNHLGLFRAKKEIEDHNRRMRRVIEEQKKAMEAEQERLLIALAKVVEKRNRDMGKHSERVGSNCRILAQGLQLTDQFEREIDDEFVEVIAMASKLHDIGTLVISDEMAKEGGVGRVSDTTEYVRLHTTEGADFLEEIGSHGTVSHFLDMAIQIAKYHHSHWDGSGYPDNRGRDIPLAARIVSIINDFDLTVRKQGGVSDARERAADIICERAGTVYDPEIIKVFSKIIRKMKTS